MLSSMIPGEIIEYLDTGKVLARPSTSRTNVKGVAGSAAPFDMRPIVIDTSWLLPAFLSRNARPHSRSLLVLTALGGLTLRRHTVEAELRRIRSAGLDRVGERLGHHVHDMLDEL